MGDKHINTQTHTRVHTRTHYTSYEKMEDCKKEESCAAYTRPASHQHSTYTVDADADADADVGFDVSAAAVGCMTWYIITYSKGK